MRIHCSIHVNYAFYFDFTELKFRRYKLFDFCTQHWEIHTYVQVCMYM